MSTTAMLAAFLRRIAFIIISPSLKLSDLRALGLHHELVAQGQFQIPAYLEYHRDFVFQKEKN